QRKHDHPALGGTRRRRNPAVDRASAPARDHHGRDRSGARASANRSARAGLLPFQGQIFLRHDPPRPTHSAPEPGRKIIAPPHASNSPSRMMGRSSTVTSVPGERRSLTRSQWIEPLFLPPPRSSSYERPSAKWTVPAIFSSKSV